MSGKSYMPNVYNLFSNFGDKVHNLSLAQNFKSFILIHTIKKKKKNFLWSHALPFSHDSAIVSTGNLLLLTIGPTKSFRGPKEKT